MSNSVVANENSAPDALQSEQRSRLSSPIDIPSQTGFSGARRSRRRAASTASSSSSSAHSPDSPSPTTPPPLNTRAPLDPAAVSPSTSPVLSYFLASTSPTSASKVLPFTRRKTVNFGTAVAEALDDEPVEVPHVFHHSRRVSASWANNGKLGPHQPGPLTGSQQERGAALMRRLSLGAAMRPTFPSSFDSGPQTSPGLQMNESPNRYPTPPRVNHRAATISAGSAAPKPRAPSPMGERMLKGHFDGW
ncbi:hypothetical protein SISSUDRAFT_1032887 [Sistotremastrum suecicum HHB10207 ss-3]|uniref:Uncharacterized protein n=1 Tax=Sistotremastrum suecicum HHB10207 ss-3 TaxID=1314776 RepID=A0A166E262_9AGAM|nr:hypothetical protein SISSUDRAFT_1032887 [Sistotremastrum suecicum HHB10207 ss-3]